MATVRTRKPSEKTLDAKALEIIHEALEGVGSPNEQSAAIRYVSTQIAYRRALDNARSAKYRFAHIANIAIDADY